MNDSAVRGYSGRWYGWLARAKEAVDFIFQNENKLSFLFLLTVALVPAILMIARVGAGISVSPDSLYYLYAAQNIFEKGALIGLNAQADAPLTIFPPLYPIALAVVGELVGSVESAAKVVNAICMIAAAGATYLLFLRFEVRRFVAALLTLGIYLHPSVQVVFWYAWSEGLYLIWVLLLLYLCRRANSWHAPQLGVLLGVIVGGAFLTRYAGIVLLPVALVGQICVNRWSVRERIVSIAACVIVSLLIVGTWVLRNYLTDGSFLGPRLMSTDTVLFALKRIAITVGAYIAPAWRFAPLYGVLGAAGLLLLGVFVGRALPFSESGFKLIAPALSMVLCHVGLLIYSQVTTVIDPINARLLSPAVVPAVIVLIGMAKQSGGLVSGQLAKFSLACISTVYLTVPALLSAKWIGEHPAGYQLNAISGVRVAAACGNGSWTVYSNQGGYLRYVRAALSPQPLPRRFPHKRTESQYNWPVFFSNLHAGKSCLIWVSGDVDSASSIYPVLNRYRGEVVVNLMSKERGVHVFELIK